WGSSSPAQVQVGGTIKLSNNAYVGTTGTHINSVEVANGCTNQSNSTVHACTSSDPVWADSIVTTPPTLTKPVIDLATWYRDAAPGPNHACTSSSGTPPSFDSGDGVQNNSLPSSVNLTPASAYDCQVSSAGQLLGELQ